MNQLAIKYALFITVASIIVKLAVYHAGLQHEELGRLSLLIPILFLLIGLLLGIRAMSKSSNNNNDEFNGFKNDAKNGIRVAAFNAIFFSAFIYLYYSQIDAGFFQYRISEGIKTLFEQGSPKEELIQYYQNAHFFLNPARQSYFTFFGYLFMGLLYSVAIAFFINTKTFKRFKA
jgi:hypothetical protein